MSWIYNIENPHQNLMYKEFDWYNEVIVNVFQKYYLVLVLCVVFYYPLIRVGQYLMKNFSPVNCKWILFVWNLLMSGFSWIGTFYLGKIIFKQHRLYDFDTNICAHELYFNSYEAYFLALFVYSKVFEWIDTVFLIIKKKKYYFFTLVSSFINYDLYMAWCII